MERAKTAGSIVIAGFIVVKCSSTAARVVVAHRVVGEGALTSGYVVAAAGVAVQRRISDRGINKASRIVGEGIVPLCCIFARVPSVRCWRW